MTAKDSMNYEKMLDRLYMSLPKQALAKERFEMPVVESHIEGTKTIVKNFSSIIKLINRDEKHLLKFITREIGTSCSISEGRLILNGKFSEKNVTELIHNYIKEFVLCRECNRPDTKFIDRQGVKVMKCEACGAISPVKHL